MDYVIIGFEIGFGIMLAWVIVATVLANAEGILAEGGLKGIGYAVLAPLYMAVMPFLALLIIIIDFFAWMFRCKPVFKGRFSWIGVGAPNSHKRDA